MVVAIFADPRFLDEIERERKLYMWEWIMQTDTGGADPGFAEHNHTTASVPKGHIHTPKINLQ